MGISLYPPFSTSPSNAEIPLSLSLSGLCALVDVVRQDLVGEGAAISTWWTGREQPRWTRRLPRGGTLCAATGVRRPRESDVCFSEVRGFLMLQHVTDLVEDPNAY